MNGSWHTVWTIAGQRNETKRGEGHLSEHCYEILAIFVRAEAAQAIHDSLGTVSFTFSSE